VFNDPLRGTTKWDRGGIRAGPLKSRAQTAEVRHNPKIEAASRLFLPVRQPSRSASRASLNIGDDTAKWGSNRFGSRASARGGAERRRRTEIPGLSG
jgi:hypothetical protein